MIVERLERLAAFLEDEVPEERFDMDQWANGDLAECGTVGCAAGWATTIPEFAEAGFVLERTRRMMTVVFERETDTSACARFFGLSWDRASWLFNSGEYDHDPVLRAEVVARIRDMVRRHYAATRRGRGR